MKPPGIGFAAVGDALVMHVTHPGRAEDAIWNAVEEAISAGWTPARFRSEVADAWRGRLEQDAKDAFAELSR